MGARGLLAFCRVAWRFSADNRRIVSAVVKAVVSGPPFMYNIDADNQLPSRPYGRHPFFKSNLHNVSESELRPMPESLGLFDDRDGYNCHNVSPGYLSKVMCPPPPPPSAAS